ncbi:MAG TPA: glycosyltransferase, partial [Kineosporiaceae bacterium]
MRVCVVHSYYSSSQPSGENTVVDLQVRTLRRLGHEVHLIAYRTDDLSRSRTYPLTSATRVATGRGGSPLRQLERLAPDVVHVHNLFPNVGAGWLTACPYPLVMTLHNFRSVCAAATLYRDGHSCRECLDQGPHRSVVHGCYRGSRTATVPLWLGTRVPRRDALLTAPDILITLSAQARAIYEPLVGQKPVECLPNPVESATQAQLTLPDDACWLYAGRLTPEKGVLDLLAAWP